MVKRRQGVRRIWECVWECVREHVCEHVCEHVRGRRAALAAWALACCAPVAWADGRGATALAACDAAAHFQVLQPEAQAWPEARALWLDRSRLQWPGALPAARARLLWAERPTLQAVVGQAATGADGSALLQPDPEPLPAAVAERFRHLAAGPRWQLPAAAAGVEHLQALHRGPVLLVLEDEQGRVQQATRVQHAAALDDLYAAAATDPRPLGVQPQGRGAAASTGADRIDAGNINAVQSAVRAEPVEALPRKRPFGRLGATAADANRRAAHTTFRLWAPTAQAVSLCLHADDRAPAQQWLPLDREAATGVWALQQPGDLSGQSYTYLVDVWVPGHGLVRQRVSDPYAISLGVDSRRAWIGRLDDPRLSPPGWDRAPRPAPLRALTDLVIYELHVRDFSIADPSVPPAHRGRYTAFEQRRSHGMRHLRALARAGLTDVHLLPVFDLASVPEQGCTTPVVPMAAPDSLQQQAAVAAVAARDCYNWGYDPLHFNAPEGSYASDAADGAVRIRELRRMVLALHRAGLRVGLDVVYNHLSASGQHAHSVLDRIVPGYYHRLNAAGLVETSTCCANSATEHTMMARLMTDSVRLWARHHRIDSFRFDLMGHQPRALMQRLREQLRQDLGHEVPLVGEGWNFGEVADGARFVQASQLSLGGAGIASFSDRGRDALRGGGHGDRGAAVVERKGWLNGSRDAALADLLRLSLAGTLRDYRFTNADGVERSGAQMRYGTQMAGYAEQPGEVVNYVENHDNQTLWDLNAFKLPLDTPAAERARVQVLGLSVTALSQGVAYFHAGVDLLRSKSMDVNSFDSGDWFNRIDWSGRHNFFGSGLPPATDNADLHALMAPRLREPSLQPAAADIAFTRRAMREWLAIRASSRLFRLDTADEVRRRLRLHGTGPDGSPTLVVAELDGRGLPGAGFARVLVLLNADPAPQTVTIASAAGAGWRLHPVQRRSADRRLRSQARIDAGSGRFTVPGRTAVVYVVR